MARILLLCFLLILRLTLVGNNLTEPYLHNLDEHIKNKDKYQRIKEEKIKFLKKFITDNPHNSQLFLYDIYEKLFEEYKSFNSNYAFEYSRKMLQTAYSLNADSLISNAKIKVAFSMLSAGLYKETLDTLKSIQATKIPLKYRIPYYKVLMRAQYDMADYSNNEYFGTFYNAKGNQYFDEVLHFSKKGTEDYLSLEGLKFLRNRDLATAKKIYCSILKNYKLSPQQYAIEASTLSYVYRSLGQNDSAVILLANAAICDIESATKETVALHNLAELLFKLGYTDRAFSYIKIALEDAYSYGAKQRKIQIADIFPFIEKKQLSLIRDQNRFYAGYSAVVTLLVLLLVLFSFIIIRQFRKLKVAKNEVNQFNRVLNEDNVKLKESNRINEVLIGHFFFTIANYIRKIETFTVTISRKLAAHKYDEIKGIVDEININNERQNLHRSFDEVFFKIFPNFISSFNKLFKEEDAIHMEENESLTVELRIFALIRLGITDNEKIAKILNYSVNTVYSYKTKIRNKSIIENDAFEQKLMEIKE
jgi:hypothetical protein